MDVSLIIPVHSGVEGLVRLFLSLDRLETEKIRAECILVADRCDESVVRRLQSWCRLKTDCRWVRCIVLPVDFGSPDKARNLGQKRASGKVLAFMDDDCRPSHKWLLSGLRHIQNWNSVTGPVVHPTTWLGISMAVMDFGEFQAKAPSAIKNAPGCNLFVRSEVISEYPTLPECGYGGDRLFAASLAELEPIRYHPDVVVFHEPKWDWKSIWSRETRYGRVAWAARLANPSLPWSSLLRLGAVAPLILATGRLVLDCKRLWFGEWPLVYKLCVTFSLFPARIGYFLGLFRQRRQKS
jgi:glycosyltransferase involved in cell wall biosynthesis